jgi:iron complex outermembrane receptor protein
VTPPGRFTPTAGTYSAIDRVAGGLRLTAEQPIGWWSGRVGFGIDAQTMRDDRLNTRSDGGRPTDTLLVDQRETVSEIGPFVTLSVEPAAELLMTAAVRYDRIRFAARDRLLDDGDDQSGGRTLGAASGSLGLSYGQGPVTGWGSVSSAFETPTTTELGNRPGGLAGFNDALAPQRATNVEAGLRWRGRLAGSFTAYRTTIRDAIVQAREESGRAYFENAGRLRHQGVEIGVDARPLSWLRARASYTHTDSRFLRYRLQDGTAVDTLDGNLVPGIPRHVLRITAMAMAGATTLELEQQLTSSQVADDRNEIAVAGWGAGVATLRASTRTSLGSGRRGVSLAPFAAIHNLFDRQYVGSVTVNGFGGRVFEPAARRWLFVGVELAWRGGGS